MNRQTITGIKSALVLLPLLLLQACGGGGGGSGSTTSTLSGAGMDGYITGATICLDLNNNGLCDTSEPTATTGANGSYSLTYPTGTNLNNLNIIAQVPVGAIDSDNPGTPISTAFKLLAPATQPLVVSPLTTLVSQYAAANGVSAQAAATQIVTALGLPAATNIFQDYLGTNNTGIHNVAQVVNTVIQNSNLGTAPTPASLTAAVAVAATFVPAATVATGSIGTLLSTATAAAASAAGNLIASVPTPSYTNDNLVVFSQLNAIRLNAGAGLIVQNTSLDTAASSHTNYLVNNNLVSNVAYLNSTVSVGGAGVLGGHYENPILSGYTASTPQTRATVAGFSTGSTGSVSELLSFGAASGVVCSASIENSVYHLVQLISPFINVGLSFNGNGPVCDIELGISSSESGQFPSAGNWVSYPGNGQTGVSPKFYNQAESPVPAADLLSAGHPVVISLYNQSNRSLTGTQVVLHTFTLTAAGSPVASRVLAQSGVTTDGTTLTVDSNISGPGILVLLPTSPLNPNTVYNVTFSATANGVFVNKSWSFTTGSMN